MNKTHSKIWYISFRQNGAELSKTKLLSRNYITAASWARWYAKELGTCDKIVLERGDVSRLYTIEL